MTSKHTPGPWAFGNTHHDDRKLILSNSGKGKYICTVQIHQTPRAFGTHEEPEREANARLIAAAPELLETLLWLDSIGGLGLRTHDRISAAIAKATGAA
ncbi:hypothetical protein V8017_16230 [Stenotrophomonas rhizophila]